MGDDRAQEHVVRGGDLVSRHPGSNHVGAYHGDDGELLLAVGFFLGSDFGFPFFELTFPPFEVGIDSAALALAEMVELEKWTVLLPMVEGCFDHGAGGGLDP